MSLADVAECKIHSRRAVGEVGGCKSVSVESATLAGHACFKNTEKVFGGRSLRGENGESRLAPSQLPTNPRTIRSAVQDFGYRQQTSACVFLFINCNDTSAISCSTIIQRFLSTSCCCYYYSLNIHIDRDCER